MQTISDVIDALGGVTNVSRIIGKPIGTVSAWKTRGSIPIEHCQALVAAGRDQGRDDITSDLLVRLHAPQPSAPAPSPEEAA